MSIESLYTFILIFLWTFVALFIIGVFILTFIYGRFSVKDDSSKALIYVKTGRHVNRPIKGTLKGAPSSKGCRFIYEKKYLFVPHTYADIYFNNKRMLFVNHLGQLIASPFDNDTPLSNDEKADLIYELTSGHIGADSMRALKGKQSMSIVIIGVVAFILGVMAVFGYNYMNDVMIQQRTQQPAQQQPANQNKPVEVR